MDVEYMRTAKKSYMIVKKADFPFEQYELTMILQNEISCLLPLQTILTDGAEEYWYDVSGMQSMGTRFQLESMDGRQLRSFLESFLKMKSDMEEYLLDDSNLCFSSDMIYFDRTGERVRFCYIPGFGAQGPAGPGGRTAAGTVNRWNFGLKGLFEEILQHLNHSDPAAVRMGYEMYERSVRSSFTLQDCLDCLQLGESVAVKMPDMSVADQDLQWRNLNSKSMEERTDFEDGEEIEFLFEEPEKKTGHRRKREKRRNPGWERGKEKEKEKDTDKDTEKEKRRRRFRETEPEEEELLFALRPDPPERAKDYGVAQETGRTEVIADDEHLSKAWELVYKGDGMESDIVLCDFPFLVGSDFNRVNAALRARTVSRVHAKFYLKEDRLFVEDFNSTNGTYLNRSLLPMNTPTELAEGDRIVFATEEYVVYRRRTADQRPFDQSF